ncbi:hypothetical protein P3T36_006130 [Kitasatospora sp. MAP12-15]|uniref:acyl-CoA carboxylase epsilon subunit n=1 Tax=unclassified Kitasatospora TaxID=2633591 RepID=UPI0024770A25|nr:acyl-CoA carboxylase epsilon subunit [Kitasatospora sp. MAP12-44]MDH6110616.1 hypothetical protein [Kitasatospora sp. MAP12-44]
MTTITLTRGTLADDELAALTAVLMARLGTRTAPEAEPAGAAGGVVVRLRTWAPAGYSSPLSWQDAA